MPVELPTEIVSYALLFKSTSIFKYVGFTLESMVTLPRFVLFVTISSDVKSIVALLNVVFTDNKLLLSIVIIIPFSDPAQNGELFFLCRLCLF